MNKPKTNNFLKLAYFDEQAAVDFLERLDEGDITEKLTKKVEKYMDVGVEGNAGKSFFNIFKLGLSGNFGRNSNSLIETQISRTVFTEFMKRSEDNKDLAKFINMNLTIAKDSLTYYRNIVPYLKLFTNLETVSDDKSLLGLNHLEMDRILDNAKGYYEFIGTGEDQRKYIIRFNINGMRNNYSLYDLVKMNLSIQGIKVGETDDINLDFQHEINVMIQETDKETPEVGANFNEEQNETDNFNEEKLSKNNHKIDIIDVIIAGVCFARPFYTILQRKSTHLCA